MGPPAKPTQPDLYGDSAWTFPTFKHPPNTYGRYKNSSEYQNPRIKEPFWMEREDKPDREIWKRDKCVVSAHITKLVGDQRDGNLPEYDNYWKEQLSRDHKEAGGGICNIVAMDLGSLCDSKESDFHKNARAYLFVLNILKVISDAAKEAEKTAGRDTLKEATRKGANLRFENGWYWETDHFYLDEIAQDTGFLGTFEDEEGWLRDGRIQPYATADGAGWKGTHGHNGDYILITFNPISPIRQLLAKYLFTAGVPQDPNEKEDKPILPRAIICRDAKLGYGYDKKHEKVEGWFERNYNKVYQFKEHEDDKPFGGDIWLYALKSEVKGNAPSAQSVQGSA